MLSCAGAQASAPWLPTSRAATRGTTSTDVAVAPLLLAIESVTRGDVALPLRSLRRTEIRRWEIEAVCQAQQERHGHSLRYYRQLTE